MSSIQSMTVAEAMADAQATARRRRRAGAFSQAMHDLGFIGNGGDPKDPATWSYPVVESSPKARVSNAQRRGVIVQEVNGLATMVRNADEDDQEAWREIGRRAGAIQRRARLLGGQPRGG